MGFLELIHSVNELLCQYKADFALLYGYHTKAGRDSAWAAKIAVFCPDKKAYADISNLIDSLTSGILAKENIELTDLARLSPFRYYEILISGKLLFVKNWRAYNKEKCEAMKRYFDYLPAFNKIQKKSVEQLYHKL